MKLRSQLVVVSLFALLLPWAGCSFVYEMETVLRTGQHDVLAAAAGSVALLIEERSAMPVAPMSAGPQGQPAYFMTAARIPAVDGYPDAEEESPLPIASYVEAYQPAEPLQADFMGVVDAAEGYLFIRVADRSIRYRNPAEDNVAGGDHIVIAVGSAGATHRYWLAPEAPGEFLARYRDQGRAVTESRIRGVWRDTTRGYQVEVHLPVALLGDRFGFTVVDGDNPNRWVGSMPPGADPGPLIRTDPQLTALLGTFARDNLRLSAVDAAGWVRGQAGDLVYREPEGDRLPPGGWILEALYRWIMVDDQNVRKIQGDTSARIDRDEVSRAIGGNPASGWYAAGDEPGGAIASVALPIRSGATVVGALVAEQSGSRIVSLTNNAVVRLLFLTLVATFLITFGLVLYASLLSLRIRRLGRCVDDSLGEDGQISAEFPVRWASDEIGDLGRHFGHLLARMRGYNEYLKSLAAKLSHELRTPLAVVSSSLDNLEHQSMSESGQQYMRRARDGAARLSRILTAMSEASRVEQSIRSAEMQRLNLNALLSNNVSGYRAAFGRSVDCVVPEDTIYIDGSPDLLAQMLDKLMDNAADFCPDSGRIGFTLRRDAGMAAITVDNTGPPLPEQMRGELFESMVSVRPEREAKPHLGLGLTIVRLVADYHGGSVSAENLPDGDGVRFRVDLPAGRG